MSVLSWFDALVLAVAAPIMLLIGVPAIGYAVGAGAWIVLRVAGAGVERAAGPGITNRGVSIRLGFMLGRLFALAIAVILVRKADGQDAGLACLAVIVFGFTLYLASSALTRPRRQR
ncbi:MAG: hypothetical protein ACRDMJ_18395 [Solirubrobacteraceae bacterium]